jgi:hypothetical protein
MYDEIATELSHAEERYFAARAAAQDRRSPEARLALKSAQQRLDLAKQEAHRILFGR